MLCVALGSGFANSIDWFSDHICVTVVADQIMLFVSTFLIAAQSTTDGIAIVICDGGEVANHIAEKE